MRTLLTIAGTLTLLCCLPGIALACDCTPPSPEQSFESAERVFIGEAIRQKGTPAKTTFRVMKILKGAVTKQVSITNRGTNCDFWFELGSVYLVYATSYKDSLITGLCSNTTVLGISTAHYKSRRHARTETSPQLESSAALCFQFRAPKTASTPGGH